MNPGLERSAPLLEAWQAPILDQARLRPLDPLEGGDRYKSLSRGVREVLTVLLADASLELVPSKLVGERRVAKVAARRRKRPSEILLDASSLGPDFVRRVDPTGKRGRPDVVHRSLLALVDSPLWVEGGLDIVMHTVEGRVFLAKPGLRPPRSYNRFVGLMEELLTQGWVGQREDPLIWEVNRSLKDLVDQIRPDLVLGLSREGGLANPLEVLDPELEILAVVGCFPAGDFSREVKEIFDTELSLHEETLSASTVASAVAWFYYYRVRWG